MNIEPSRAEQLAAAIDTLVAEMVAAPWPTTPQEHTRRAAQVGLPTTGQPDPDMDESTPDSSHLVAPSHPWALSWHYFQGEFVGISLFPGRDLHPDELPTFARLFRREMGRRREHRCAATAHSLHELLVARPLHG